MKNEYQFSNKLLNTLTEQIAVIDKLGNIIYVNESWINFSDNNDGVIERTKWKEINYLETSDRSAKDGDTLALDASKGIKSIISGEKKSFFLEYPCHSP